MRKQVAASEELVEACQPGLKGLGANSGRVRSKDGRRFRASVNFDEALQPMHPQASRWDYVVEFAGRGLTAMVWVEVHPATSGQNLAEVMAKKEWSEAWARKNVPKLDRRRWVWVSTGEVCFPANSAQRKRVAEKSIQLVARVVDFDRLIG